MATGRLQSMLKVLLDLGLHFYSILRITDTILMTKTALSLNNGRMKSARPQIATSTEGKDAH